VSTDVIDRPASPWTGSTFETRHRWQLEHLTALAEVISALRELAAELAAAHAAGWWLVAPMRGGHLLAARPSRRQRARVGRPAPAVTAAPCPSGWRLRVLAEPAASGEDVLDCDVLVGTPVLHLAAGAARCVGGPEVPPDVLEEVARQTDGLSGRWALTSARVGPARDVVADGSALRLHAVVQGTLVRTREALSFQHAADGASTLEQAAVAYARLADATETLAVAGGHLEAVDDGFVHVRLAGGR